jgi:ubiquinone/menaquinone biosynthesis C-methylase UbiE
MHERIPLTMDKPKAFVPAAGRHSFLPFYDPFTALLGAERERRRLVGQAELRSGQHALEVGCGTGSLALQIKRLNPQVEVVGLDPDTKALDRARRKAARAGFSVQFDQGYADRLPYPDASFDRVFSSLMFHHLELADKAQMLSEIRRVLKPGGRLELLDLVPAAKKHRLMPRFLHGHELMKDNSEERIIALMKEAGFGDARRVGYGHMLVGRTGYYQASLSAG